MSLHVEQLRDQVVIPTLTHLGLYSVAAEALLLGTAAQESHLRYLVQLGGGPARGLWQMEPATHDDIWTHYLRYKPELAARVRRIMVPSWNAHEQLVWHLAYACAMARIHYWRVPRPLPAAGDVDGQARYWKLYYNTPLGRGRMEEYVRSWRTYGAPYLTYP